MHFVVLEYCSVKRISMDYELDFAQKSINVFVLHSSDITLNAGMKNLAANRLSLFEVALSGHLLG